VPAIPCDIASPVSRRTGTRIKPALEQNLQSRSAKSGARFICGGNAASRGVGVTDTNELELS